MSSSTSLWGWHCFSPKRSLALINYTVLDVRFHISSSRDGASAVLLCWCLGVNPGSTAQCLVPTGSFEERNLAVGNGSLRFFLTVVVWSPFFFFVFLSVRRSLALSYFPYDRVWCLRQGAK